MGTKEVREAVKVMVDSTRETVKGVAGLKPRAAGSCRCTTQSLE